MTTDFYVGQRVEIVPKGRTWVSDSHGIVTRLHDGCVYLRVGTQVHRFWPGYLRPTQEG